MLYKRSLPVLVSLLVASTASAQFSVGQSAALRAEATPKGLRLRRQEALTIVPTGIQSLLIGGSGQLWAYPSDGSWIAETVAIGNYGSTVFSAWGVYERRSGLFSAFDDAPLPEPVWTNSSLEFNWRRRTASAEGIDRYADLHQRLATPGSNDRKADLAIFGSASEVPLWTYTMPTTLPALTESELEMTPDGSITLAYVFESQTGSALLTRVRAQEGEQGAPSFAVEAEGRVPLSGIPLAFTMSEDGSTVAFGNTFQITVVDATSMSVVQEIGHLGQPQYGALDLSPDGSRLVFGTLGRVRVFERGSDGLYAGIAEHSLEPTEFCLRASLSPDASTMTLGVHKFGAMGDALLRTVEIESDATLFEKSYSSGSQLQNYVSQIEYSDDGRVVAVGLWGDAGAGEAPEFVAFSVDTAAVLLERDFEGSVLDLDLARDGGRVAIASKGVHANVFGGGGAFSLLQLGVQDVLVRGVPRAGSTIQVGTVLREGRQAGLIGASSLLLSPIESPTLFEQVLNGWLYVDPSLPLIQQGPSIVEEENVSWWPYTVPGGSSDVGEALYFQGLDLTDLVMGSDLARFTILPPSQP